MPRRVNMPGADELFRATAKQAPREQAEVDDVAQDASNDVPADTSRSGSGRIKHDEKMTVYITSAELLAVEQARLRLRGSLGRNVDRGRLVRAALALALEDLEERGTESDVARRLRDS